MQLPKKPHSPQSYKKKPISKESQQVNESTSHKSQVNESTGQRVNEKSNYQDFEISREPRLSS